jgi:hypothetical protein
MDPSGFGSVADILEQRGDDLAVHRTQLEHPCARLERLAPVLVRPEERALLGPAEI